MGCTIASCFIRRPVWCVVVLFIWALATQADGPINLLTNPGFEDNSRPGTPIGWSPFWSRTADAGSMELDGTITHSGKFAIKISHRATTDWSVAAVTSIPVQSGDIMKLSGWMRCEAATNACFSVIARKADNSVISWALGQTTCTEMQGWQYISRRFLVPEECTNIQFRIIGSGPAVLWADDIALSSLGSLQAYTAQKSAGYKAIANRYLQVRLADNCGQLVVTDRRNRRVWTQCSRNQGIVVKKVAIVRPTSMRLTLWDVLNDGEFTATITLVADRPELTVELAGQGHLQNAITFPQPFVTGKGTALVVPMNEGILFPVDDATVKPLSLATYTGHGLCMPWYGVVDTANGAGVMTIIRSPDDAGINMTRQEGGDLYIQPRWEASRGELRYTRALSYLFFTRGGYAAQAKYYRGYAQRIGLFTTLAAKCRENPNVDLLIGAANVWSWGSNRLAITNEMKSLGMEHVLWSNAGSSDEVTAIRKLGYLTSRYDNYQDVYPPNNGHNTMTEGWPEDLVLLSDGSWMKGWAQILTGPDGKQIVNQGGVICSSQQLNHAKRHIPVELKTTPYQCRFIDTVTASPWRECYNSAHPLTRSDDRKNKMALLNYVSHDMKLVTGTETGIDPSVPYVHYYEGMLSLAPYRLPDSGRDITKYKTPTPDFLKYQVGSFYRIPLWELVYHDCTVAQWYWGDASNKAPEVWDQRDLINILYATPPMFAFDQAQWTTCKDRFVQSYKNVCPIARKLGYDEMLSHVFLNAEHTVQQTRWKSGAEITVNFGDTPYTLPDGRIIAAKGWGTRGM